MTYRSSTPECSTIPVRPPPYFFFSPGWEVTVEGHHERGHPMTASMGRLCFQIRSSWFWFFQVFLVMKVIHCHLLKKLRGYRKPRFLWEKPKWPFNWLGLGGLAQCQTISFLLIHREINPSLSLPHWFRGSLVQLCSCHRSYGTPGFFHSGNLEVVSRAHRGNVCKNTATQGCCTLPETLGRCQPTEAEKASHYTL